MRKLSYILSLSVALAASSSFAGTIVTVNGTKITDDQVENTLKQLPEHLLATDMEQVKQTVIDRLIDRALVIQDAKKNDLDDSKKYEEEMKKVAEDMLYGMALQEKIDSEITPEALEKAYNDTKADYARERVHARHILVESESEAQDLIKQLTRGADFAELAKEESKGPSAPRGGDLGWFAKGQMVPEFEAVAFNLEAGTFSKEPVKTQFGWHVVKVEERQEKAEPSKEELTPHLRKLMAQRAVESYVEGLKAKAKINYEN